MFSVYNILLLPVIDSRLFILISSYFSKVSNVGQSGNALGNSGQQQTYNGIKDVFKTVYKEGGARSLYRGVGMYYPLIASFPLL